MMSGVDILAAIEERRYTDAKREISKQIAKTPKKLYYQALNAFYLVATATVPEAANACHAVRKQNPHDAPTLDLLFDCYTRLALYDDAHQVYETAAKRNPTDGLLLVWFKKAYSNFDYATMRTSATTMCKKAPSSRTFKLYSAFSTYMWSLGRDDADSALDSAISLLAGARPFENTDEACLYAKLLVKVGKLSDVVDLIRSTAQRPLELTLMYLSALEDTENWTDLFKESENLLFKQAFNDYNTWKRFIKASFKLDKSYSETASRIVLGSRNSYVANIYLNEVYGVSLEAPIDTYYKEFQSKPCCALDLSNFKVSESFVSNINTKKKDLLAKSDLSSDEVAVVINIEKINSFNGSKVDWTAYSKYETPEFSDLFLASMVQNMGSGFTTSDTLKYIVQLEHWAKKDPENFYIKVWLLNLYSLLNVPGLALDTYKGLKIKMIQHDVLAYKLSLNPSLKNLTELIQIYRFYMTSEKEIARYLEIAMKKGLYTKLEDLFSFGKRLTHSISRHLLVANILRMSRILGHDYYDFFLNIVQDKRGEILADSFFTSDNRDFDTDYRFGFKVDQISLFSQESKKTSKHVRLLYAKELLIAEQNVERGSEILETFGSLMEDKSVTDAMVPSDQYFFRIYLNFFKTCKAQQNKDSEEFVEHVEKNATFAVIKEFFLSKTTPLSSSANQILTNVSELVKVIKSNSKEKRLLDVATKLQKDLVGYVITNPELSFLKEMRSTLEIGNLDNGFVGTQMDRIEDAARDSKFKLK